MLRRTFVHLPRVGYETERKLWAAGVRGWAEAVDRVAPPAGFSAARWHEVCRRLEASACCLERREHRHFAEALAPRDHWRAFPDFSRRVGYLDIETTGMGAWAQVTVVGLYDGRRTESFVAGDNLEAFPEAVARCAVLVTYNGAAFDLPFLRRRFPDFPRDVLHVDLCPLLRRLGLSGGLKGVERQLGLARDDDLAGLDGFDAVRLWQEYGRGSREALDLLVRYNAADVENLEPLMRLGYEQMWQRTLREEGAE